MRAAKAKALRREAATLTIGQPNKFIIGTHKGKTRSLYLEHARSCTRAVYQRLKRVN